MSAPAKLGKARQSKTMFVICSSLESGAKRKSFLLVLVLHVKLKVMSISLEEGSPLLKCMEAKTKCSLQS